MLLSFLLAKKFKYQINLVADGIRSLFMVNIEATIKARKQKAGSFFLIFFGGGESFNLEGDWS